MLIYSNYPLLLLQLITLCLSCSSTSGKSSPEPPSHEEWTALLLTHVKKDGLVDYKAFVRDKVQLEKYLKVLSDNAPDPEKWSEAEQLAYWINAYNAFTMKLIVDNYPLKSIKDIKLINIPLISSVWSQKFFSVGGKKMSLDNIEHDILRKEFEEPRIHFAINCASMSCPKLRAEAFLPDKLEKQLNEQAVDFITDPTRNRLSRNRVEISKIFNWFKLDFTRNGTLVDFLNQYAQTKISDDTEINYMNYDWDLNDVN